jgi:hypothetical protein
VILIRVLREDATARAGQGRIASRGSSFPVGANGETSTDTIAVVVAPRHGGR